MGKGHIYEEKFVDFHYYTGMTSKADFTAGYSLKKRNSTCKSKPTIRDAYILYCQFVWQSKYNRDCNFRHL